MKVYVVQNHTEVIALFESRKDAEKMEHYLSEAEEYCCGAYAEEVFPEGKLGDAIRKINDEWYGDEERPAEVKHALRHCADYVEEGKK